MIYYKLMQVKKIMTKNKTFYITTPIYYVNGAPHVGHCYTTLACDVMARFKRLDDYDVKFLTGTDENGQKVEQAANKAKKTPQEFVDGISETFVDLVKLMNFEPDVFDTLGKYKENNFSFIRTTNPKHKEVVQDVWKKLVKNGWIYRGKYKGWYCVSDEAYYTEDDLVKDEGGEWRTELGKSVEWREEDSYFFRLKDFKEILLGLYKRYPDFVQPETRRNEVVSFVNILDRDLSVSRNTFDWGIKISCDEKGNDLLDGNGEWKDSVKDEDRHVIYVWLDALFNYISALGGLDGEDYGKYWKKRFIQKEKEVNVEGSTKFYNEFGNRVVHVMAKEIIRFHAVYWPAFLIACEHGRDELEGKSNITEDVLNKGILPSIVFAHGFWECEGRKMSKSFGNIVVPEEEIEWLQKEFGISKEVAIDYFRYFLITEIPFGNDGNYTRRRLVERVNSELVNNIGNLVQRTLSMIYKNLDARIPDISNNPEISNAFKHSFEGIRRAIDKFEYDVYARQILHVASLANEYIEKEKPWELKKTNPEKLPGVLYVLVELVRKIAILLQPFCPTLAKRVLTQLNLESDKVLFSFLEGEANYLKPGTVIEKPEGIFPRLKKNI